jgi:preprotein translocase subunit Sec61beta
MKIKMSSIRKRSSQTRDSGPMPATGAGLMRYYDETMGGFEIGPMVAVLYTSFLIIAVLASKITDFNPFFFV